MVLHTRCLQTNISVFRNMKTCSLVYRQDLHNKTHNIEMQLRHNRCESLNSYEYGLFRETSHLRHHGTSMITYAAGCSETSVYIYQPKRIHNSEDIKLQGHDRRSNKFQNYNRNHNTTNSRCLSVFPATPAPRADKPSRLAD